MASPSSSSPDQSSKTLTNYIRSKTTFDERFAVFITRHKMKLSDNAQSALLVVVGLLVAPPSLPYSVPLKSENLGGFATLQASSLVPLLRGSTAIADDSSPELVISALMLNLLEKKM
ncbi:hypothetical protein PTKIN_Ptkin05aG0024700 [Pterospermum kingtungense]